MASDKPSYTSAFKGVILEAESGAKDLSAGSLLLTVDGIRVAVQSVSIEALDEPVAVYNLEVEDYHTYFVSQDGVLVHNTCRQYKPNAGKHGEVAKGNISADPFHNNQSAGQEVLNSAYASDDTKQLYNIYNGRVVKFQPDNAGGYHAYYVMNTSAEVPTSVYKKMLTDGVISHSQYNKFIHNK